MAAVNITQLRRISVVRKAADGGFSVYNYGENDLGQDSLMTLNITPRTTSRASQMGTSETPIPGTIDSFAASMTILMDNFEALGQGLGIWNPATYAGAGNGNGNITDAGSNVCASNETVMIVCSGVCDDGSSADIVLPRCLPALDSDIEFGGSDTAEVTINLHPVIYSASRHAEDGFPQCSYRLGDASLTEKLRFNATTGKWVTPGAPEETEPDTEA